MEATIQPRELSAVIILSLSRDTKSYRNEIKEDGRPSAASPDRKNLLPSFLLHSNFLKAAALRVVSLSLLGARGSEV